MAGNRYLAVPRLQPGWENNYEASPAVFQVAGFGKILRYDPLPDGRANIVLLGLGRIRIRSELQPDSLYRVAEGSLLVRCAAQQEGCTVDCGPHREAAHDVGPDCWRAPGVGGTR